MVQLFFILHIYTLFNEKFGPISGSIGIWPKPIIGLDQQYIVETVTKVKFVFDENGYSLGIAH